MIEQLFTHNKAGDAIPQHALVANTNGLATNRQCHPWRHVLILPSSTLTEFGLKPAALRENILLSEDIHSLPSGTVVKFGEVEIRLTFHYEPCKKLKPLVNPNKLLQKRGYLGQIISGGTIRLGDLMIITKQTFEPIPYEITARIKWYLDRLEKPIFVAELVDNIGLSRSYCRAIPNIVKSRTDIDKNKILYQSKQLKP